MRKTIFALAASMAIPLFAQNPLLDQGRAALDRRDYRAASRIFESALAQQPNNAEAHYLLGIAYGRMAEHAMVLRQPDLAWRTRAEFERAVESDPNHLRARFALIEYYMMAPAIFGGDNGKAYQQASEIRHRDAEKGHRAYAMIYTHERRFDLARDEYASMVHDAPQSAEAHYTYALFLSQRNNYKVAADEFEATVRIDPSNMPAWFHIGRIASITKQNLPRGAEALRKYLSYTPQGEDDPSPAQAQTLLGAINDQIAGQPEALAGHGMRRTSPRR